MTTHPMLIADLAIEPVACVPPGISLAQAARVLSDTRQGVLVVDAQPPWELFGEDIVDAIAAGRSPGTHLDQLAVDAPQFVRPETPAEDAAAAMLVTGHASVVVLDEGRPLGVVPLRAVVSALWGATSWSTAFRLALHLDTTQPLLKGGAAWPD
jgi:CBS domain-containing protein